MGSLDRESDHDRSSLKLRTVGEMVGAVIDSESDRDGPLRLKLCVKGSGFEVEKDVVADAREVDGVPVGVLERDLSRVKDFDWLC